MTNCYGACLLLIGFNANAAEPQQSAVVNDFVAAVNAKDAARVESLLASDFVMPKRDPSCDAGQSDRACMLAYLNRTLLKANAHLTVDDVRSEREITRANLEVTSDAIRAAGSKRILVTKEFITNNGKIQSLISTLRTEDPDTAAYKKRASS